MAGLFSIPAPVLIPGPIYLSCLFPQITNRFRFYRPSSAKVRRNSLPMGDGLRTLHSSLGGPRLPLLPSPGPVAVSGRFRPQAVVLPDGGVTARRYSFSLLTTP